jgi:hypothetical protein
MGAKERVHLTDNFIVKNFSNLVFVFQKASQGRNFSFLNLGRASMEFLPLNLKDLEKIPNF